jgi:hypothetical protein
MKKVIPILLLAFVLLSSATVAAQKIHYKTITQKECVKKKGYRLVLKQVVSDSRCPEGVTCVWAGEVSFVLSVYKDKKFVEDVTLSSANREQNLELFSKYLRKKVTSVGVLPYPKQGVSVDPESYVLKIGYSR